MLNFPSNSIFPNVFSFPNNSIFPSTSIYPGDSANPIAFHPDTLNWRDRAIANGGIVDDIDMQALNPFVEGIYDLGLRSKTSFEHVVFELLPLIGGNLKACLTKLWYPNNTVINCTNINFVEEDYSRSEGLKSDGTTKYLDSNINLAQFEITNSVALGVYNCTPGAFNAVEIGVEGIGDSYHRLFLQVRYSDSIGSFDCYHFTSAARAGVDMSTVEGSTGFILGSRLSATDSRFFKNGSEIAAINSIEGFVPNSNLTYFKANNAGYPTISPRSLGLIMVCQKGIPINKVAPLNTLVQNMMSALGRAV